MATKYRFKIFFLLFFLQAFSAHAGRAIKLLKVPYGNFSQTCTPFSNNETVEHVVGKNDSLSFSYGLNTSAWKDTSGLYEFGVSAQSPEKGVVSLLHVLIDPADKATVQGWNDATISLDLFEGQKIKISFNARVLSRQKLPLSDPGREKFLLWGGRRIGNFTRGQGEYNLVLVSLDTLRADRVSLNGYFRKTTPNLDDMASAGVYFQEAISQSPWTRPSHMSVMTGLYPHGHGVTDSWKKRTLNELDPDITTLAEVFQRNGYATHAITGGANMAAAFGFDRGFDRYLETAGQEFGPDSDFIFPLGFRWMAKHKEEKFFLFLHTYEIHRPFTRRRFLEDKSVKMTAQERTDAQYDSDVFYADKYIGKLKRKIEELGLEKNTILIVFSDHGEDLGSHYQGVDHGHTLYEEMIHVPLLFYAPGLFKPTLIKNYQAQLIDIMPTLFDFFQFPLNGLAFHGKSLLPFLMGAQLPVKSIAFSEALAHPPERKSIRFQDATGKRKFILAPEFEDLSLKEDSWESENWGKAMRAFISKWKGRELYNLKNDPHEKKNIVEKNDPYLSHLEELMKSFIDAGRSSVSKKEGPPVDAELLEQLKSLGY